jgi:hypothetical protein
MTLNNDIDAPLVNTIAYLNLLGVSTLWSCCGYNYKEQPTHKAHQLGQIQISMAATDLSSAVGVRIIQTNPGWLLKHQLVAPDKRAFIVFCDILKMHPNWNETSVHYHEYPSQMILGMEHCLYMLKPSFKDEVILTDTNHLAKQVNPYWDYVGCDPWVIRKSDYV